MGLKNDVAIFLKLAVLKIKKLMLSHAKLHGCAHHSSAYVCYYIRMAMCNCLRCVRALLLVVQCSMCVLVNEVCTLVGSGSLSV